MVFVEGSFTRCTPHRAAETGVAPKPMQERLEREAVARREEESGLTIYNNLRKGTHTRRYNRPTMSHGLGRSKPECLDALAWHDDEPRTAVEASKLLPIEMPYEPDIWAGALRHVSYILSGAGDMKRDPELCGRGDEIPNPFVLRDAAHIADVPAASCVGALPGHFHHMCDDRQARWVNSEPN